MGKIKLITVERGSKLNREDVQKALASAFKNDKAVKFTVRPIPGSAPDAGKKTA